MNILLIEPDLPLAQTYARYLETRGHTVALSHHAQAAIFAADAQTPDVVLLELHLPAHNGVEFLYEFRSYPDWQTVPVVLLTRVPAHALRMPQSQMDRLLIADVVYKPGASLLTIGRAAEAAATTARA